MKTDSRIVLIGDLAFAGNFSMTPNENNKRFEEVLPHLIGNDIVFANLEMPVKIKEEKNENKNFIHHSLPEPTRELLKKLNISCVSLANNHIYDCKMSGLRGTIEILDSLGIYHTGAGWEKEQCEPVIIKNHKQTIGFIAYVDISTNPKVDNFLDLFINIFEIGKVLNDIRNLRGKVDKIICSLHWGIDYSNFFSLHQQVVARALIDGGADIIMGHHPHTIQPYEEYKNGLIFYSLGQLCFGDFFWEGKIRSLKRKTKLGMIVYFNEFSSNSFSIIPTLEQKGNIITIPKIDINKLIKRYKSFNQLKNKYQIINILLGIKESFIDRIYDFFFGYYRNPINQIFEFKNIRKIKYIARDFHHKK